MSWHVTNQFRVVITGPCFVFDEYGFGLHITLADPSCLARNNIFRIFYYLEPGDQADPVYTILYDSDHVLSSPFIYLLHPFPLWLSRPVHNPNIIPWPLQYDSWPLG